MLREIVDSVSTYILQLDSNEFFVAAIVVSFIAVYAFYQMAKRLHIGRLIENTPTSKVRSAAQGYTELNGKAKLMDGPTITSPLTGRSCVWYHYTIERKVTYQDSRGHTVTNWQVIKEQTSDELFLLEDETGRCVIDPDNAEVVTTDKRTWYKHSISRRYTEELITEHEPLYAIGLFKTVGRIERYKLRLHINELLRSWKKSPNLLLLKYDANNDGKLDQTEWEKVRLAAEKQVLREHDKQESLNILEMSQNTNQAFILSTLSEQKLIKLYKIHAMGYILTFFISGSLVVWAMNVRLGG